MNNLLKKRLEEENYKLVSIDLFSGPGGLCTGFKWAGILPLIAIEWVGTTAKTYALNHNTDFFELNNYLENEKYINDFIQETSKSLIIHGDINLVDEILIKKLLIYRYGINSIDETVDVISGGAPCESFSLAGSRIINDNRDNLFLNIIRISKILNPKIILFENVKGLFSKSKGTIFNYICNSFENINYKLVSRNPEEIVLCAADYGVPQLRERLFLVGIRNDLNNINFQYPNKEYGLNTNKSYITVNEAISDLPFVESGQENENYIEPVNYINNNQKDFINIMRGNFINNKINSNIPKYINFINNKITLNKGPGHTLKKKKLISIIPENESMKTTYELLNTNNTFEQYKDLFPNVIYASRNRRLNNNKPSFTVTSHCLDEMLHPTLTRAITAREAARLQSFPDWYYFEGPYVTFHGNKDQDKYEQIGDAIPPLLACAIGNQIKESLINN